MFMRILIKYRVRYLTAIPGAQRLILSEKRVFQQKGIGAVEIVMMLVILAIFATTAIPSFIPDKASARQAAVDGIAGSLSSASAINFTVRSISNSNGVAINNCKDVVKALEGSLGEDYIVNAAPIPSGARMECRVVHKQGEWARFIAQGVS